MEMLSAYFRISLEVSLSMVPVMAVLLLCRPLLRRHYRAKWTYWAWLLVAVRLLLPVNLSLSMVTPVSIPEPMAWVNQPVAAAPTPQPAPEVGSAAALPEPVAGEAPVVPSPPVIDGWTATALVWLVGAACALTLQLVPYVRFRRRVKRWSTPLAAPEFDALCREMDATGLRLASCAGVTSPMVSGFFCPTLLLPAEEAVPPEPILRHEILHYKRRDLWYKVLLLVGQCIHWFNPLVWLMGRAANQDLERACDEGVTAGRPEAYREEYGRAILDAVDNGLATRAPLTSYFHGGKSAMLERLGCILDTEGKKRGTAVLCLLLAAAVLGTALFSAGRNVVMEDDEFQILLPHGTMWVGPNQKPGLDTQFYQDGVQAGGLEMHDGTLAVLGTILGENADYVGRESALTSELMPVEEWTQTQPEVPYEVLHYVIQIEEERFCDLWFRLDLFSEGEAAAAAKRFVDSLGAAHAKSPNGRYDLSYIMSDGGGCRWFLRERGKLVGTVHTSAMVLWQTAQWSPDGRWASAWDSDERGRNFVVFSLENGALGTQHPDWTADLYTPIAWGKDNRLQFSYVRKLAATLESGTAWYDPVTGAVDDVAEDAPAVPVFFAPIAPGVLPPWTMPIPADIEVRADTEMPGGAVLLKDGEEVGLVLPAEAGDRGEDQLVGIYRFYTNYKRLGGGAMAAVIPIGGDKAYEVILRDDLFRQDMADEMVSRFTLE